MAILPGDEANPINVPTPTRPIVSYTGGIAERAQVDRGEALAGLGQSVTADALKIQEARDKIGSAAAEQNFLSKKLDLDQQFAQDKDPATAPQRYRQALQDALAETGQGLVGQVNRAEYQNRMSRWVEYGTNSMLRESTAKVRDQGRADTQNAVDQAVKDALRAPDEPTRMGLFMAVQSRIQAAEGAGLITNTEGEKLWRSTQTGYGNARAKMLVDSDPAMAVKALGPSGVGDDGTPMFDKANDWRDFVDPAHRMDLVREAQQRTTALTTASEVNELRRERLKQKAETDAANGAAQEYIQKLAQDPSQVDPVSIAGDKRFAPSQWHVQEGLIKATQAALNKDTDHDTKTYGAGFWDAFKGVNAPQGDPNRITDPAQIIARAGPDGDLTLAGVKALMSEMHGRSTPEGEAEATMKKTFLQNARGEITGTNEGLHLRDPKGDELYLKFLAQALPAYDAGRKAGKSAAELLDPGSKDYIGASIKTFKRPVSQWTSDMLQDNGAGAAATPAPAIDLGSQQGIVAAFQSGKLSREDAGAALTKIGIKFENPARTPAPAEPSAPIR